MLSSNFLGGNSKKHFAKPLANQVSVGITSATQVELIRKLRKSIEGLVQVGLSIGLPHVTEVMLLKDERSLTE